MTEREKQLKGFFYNGADRELKAMQNKAQKLVRQINHLDLEMEEEQKELLKELLGHAGKNLRIYPPFHVDFGVNIFTGDNVFINQNCMFLDNNTISIGERVMFGPNVKVFAGDHPLEGCERYREIEKGIYQIESFSKSVKIGNDVWIGGGAIILPGITIGNNVVIGAGSVVTKNIDNNIVVAGNPARIIRRLGGK